MRTGAIHLQRLHLLDAVVQVGLRLDPIAVGHPVLLTLGVELAAQRFEAGVEMRRPGGPAGVRGPEPEAETITALYRAGHSLKAIGTAVGLSDATAWRRLRSAGVETRRPGKPSRAAQPLVDVEWCRQMREDGPSIEEIAGRLSVAPAMVAIQLGGR